MLNNARYMQNFYYEQNIQLRRHIRQLDMEFAEITNNKSINKQIIKQQQLAKQQINFFVIGPQKSGKSSLLKTIFFALNSHQNMEISLNQLPMTIIKRFDIKKNKKYKIEGLTKMKESDQKRTITGFEFQTKITSFFQKQISKEQQSNYTFQKYSHALQMIDNKMIGCLNISPPFSNNIKNIFSSQMNSFSQDSIKTVIIVLNIISRIEFQQISCLKFFLSDIRQKGIKTLIVLTHIDKLGKLKQNDKLLLIEERIQILKNQLDVKDRDDFICVENYTQNTQNNYTQNTKNNVFKQKRPTFTKQANNVKNMNNGQYGQPKQLYTDQSNLNKINRHETVFNQSFIIDVPHISNRHIKTQTTEKFNSILLSNNPTSLLQNKPTSLLTNHQTSLLSNNPNYSNSRQPQIQSNKIWQPRKPTLQNNNKILRRKQILESQVKYNLGLQSFYSQREIEKSFYSQREIEKSKDRHNQDNWINKQEINFYGLKLLIRIIKENEKYNKQMKTRKLKWFCG